MYSTKLCQRDSSRGDATILASSIGARHWCIVPGPTIPATYIIESSPEEFSSPPARGQVVPVAHIVAADELVPRAPTKRELLLVQRELWLACLARLEAHTDALTRWLSDSLAL